MDNLYLKKYLKYKLKYNKIKGGGRICSSDFNTFVKGINIAILNNKSYESKISNFFDFMKKCIIVYNSIQDSTYVKCDNDFHKNQKFSKLAQGTYNYAFKSSIAELSDKVYLRAKDPTYDLDEINLLINLNNRCVNLWFIQFNNY